MPQVRRTAETFRRAIAHAALFALPILIGPQQAVAEAGLPQPAEPCTLEPGPVRTVTRVLDGETLQLDDGRAVRLIGALAPRAQEVGAGAGAWPPENAGLAALSDLALGKKIKLAFGGRQADRYGRYLAQVFLLERGTQEWLQGTLLAAGHARAYGLPGSFTCARELLAHEAEARAAKRGLWANATYRAKPAKWPGYVMTLRGRYERVEGTVASVSQTKSATYLNFGNDWRSDFTARIGKEVLSAHAGFDQLATTLKGRTICVRGWIERRNGPMIDVADPSQIEMLDTGEQNETPVSQRAAPSATEKASTPPSKSSESPRHPAAPNEPRPDPSPETEPGAVDL